MINKINTGALVNEKKDPRNYKLSMFNPNIDKNPIIERSCKLKMPNIDFIMEQYGNSCVAHAIVLGKQFLEYQLTGKWMDFDKYITYGYRTDDQWLGEGMYLQEALDNGLHVGFFPTSGFNTIDEMPTLKTWVDDFLEDNPDKLEEAKDYVLSGYGEVTTYREVMSAIELGMPVMAAWQLYDSFFETSSDGIVKVPDKSTESYLGNHAMLIVGVDTEKRYYIVANSYGKQYGFKGMYFIPFEYEAVEMYIMSDKISPARPKAKNIHMTIGDSIVKINDSKYVTTPPTIINDRTYIPSDIICMYLGASIEDKGDIVIIRSEEAVVELTIDSNNYRVNGAFNSDNTYTPYRVDDIIMIPVRLVSEIMNYNVEWVDSTKEVILTAL